MLLASISARPRNKTQRDQTERSRAALPRNLPRFASHNSEEKTFQELSPLDGLDEQNSTYRTVCRFYWADLLVVCPVPRGRNATAEFRVSGIRETEPFSRRVLAGGLTRWTRRREGNEPGEESGTYSFVFFVGGGKNRELLFSKASSSKQMKECY